MKALGRMKQLVPMCLLVILVGIVSNFAQTQGEVEYKPLSFELLRSYIPGQEPPNAVKELDGANVEVKGFMSAILELQDMKEFVVSFMPPIGCFCHPAMRINEAVYVQMPEGETINFSQGFIVVQGTLSVNQNIQDEFDDVMYTLKLHRIK